MDLDLWMELETNLFFFFLPVIAFIRSFPAQ